MPTYWISSPYSFSADAPVHGGQVVVKAGSILRYRKVAP